MRRLGIGGCVLALLLLCGIAWGQEAAPAAQDETAARLAETQMRLEATQRRLDELNSKFDAMCAQMEGVCGQVDEYGREMTSVATQVKALEERTRAIADPVGLRFKPYGYIKFDAAYDSTRTSGTAATAFVLPEGPGFRGDRHFTMTVRQTRFGVDIMGPELEGATSAGKIEIDFYAPASIENKAEPMLRAAYWQLSYPTWNVLVGQTWEVVSPNFPNLVNYAYLALSGNPGYRKPMVRYQRMDKVRGGRTLQTDLALARGIGSTIRSAASLDDEASDAGFPDFQARVGVSSPTDKGRPMVIGVSGHWGQEEYDPVGSGDGSYYSTYSGNLDWLIPFTSQIWLTGEFWMGRNMDGYMGGIGQGVNLTLGEGIDAIGGWTQLSYAPVKPWLFSVGAGIDDPDDSNLSAGMRSFNATYFTNAWYSLNERTRLALEVSYQTTRYIAGPNGDNVRVQTALQYNF